MRRLFASTSHTRLRVSIRIRTSRSSCGQPSCTKYGGRPMILWRGCLWAPGIALRTRFNFRDRLSLLPPTAWRFDCPAMCVPCEACVHTNAVSTHSGRVEQSGSLLGVQHSYGVPNLCDMIESQPGFAALHLDDMSLGLWAVSSQSNPPLWSFPLRDLMHIDVRFVQAFPSPHGPLVCVGSSAGQTFIVDAAVRTPSRPATSACVIASHVWPCLNMLCAPCGVVGLL